MRLQPPEVERLIDIAAEQRKRAELAEAACDEWAKQYAALKADKPPEPVEMIRAVAYLSAILDDNVRMRAELKILKGTR